MLHYEVQGVGNRTLVCLHGFLESISMWEGLRLHEGARLVLIDLPGHGKSTLDGIDSMQSMAERVKEVLDNESVSEYEVIGHSMGGYVALELKQLDDRCQKVVLMNSNVWTDSDQKKEDRKRVAKLVQTKKDRFISEAIPNLFENPESHLEHVKVLIAEAKCISAEAIARASIAMSERRDFSEEVFSGELEVTVIQGENDAVAPQDRMKPLMVNQSDRFYVVPSGHMAHLEATELVREITLEFVR